jgi:hypothetical protein
MKKEPDVYEVEVAAAQPTLHCITAEVGDVECLTAGKASAERLIEESFRFLLERESNISILRSFRITDIVHPLIPFPTLLGRNGLFRAPVVRGRVASVHLVIRITRTW